MSSSMAATAPGISPSDVQDAKPAAIDKKRPPQEGLSSYKYLADGFIVYPRSKKTKFHNSPQDLQGSASPEIQFYSNSYHNAAKLPSTTTHSPVATLKQAPSTTTAVTPFLEGDSACLAMGGHNQSGVQTYTWGSGTATTKAASVPRGQDAIHLSGGHLYDLGKRTQQENQGSATPLFPQEFDAVVAELFSQNEDADIDPETAEQVEEYWEKEKADWFHENHNEAVRFIQELQNILFRVLVQFGINANTDYAIPKLLPRENMVVFAQRLFKIKELFRLGTKPSLCDIAYHYTQGCYMDEIRRSGLLNKKERDAADIKSRFNGAALGDGIYTCRDPVKFKTGRYGDTGIMIARIRGVEVDYSRPNRGNRRSHSAGVGNDTEQQEESDSVTRSRGMLSGCAVLKQSDQCVCLIEFPAAMIGSKLSGTKSSERSGDVNVGSVNGDQVIKVLHVEVQKCIDKFFNDGKVTKIPVLFPARSSCSDRNQTPQAHPALQPKVAPTGPLNPTSGTPLALLATKKEKERFLVFTKVLMKYLEQKEPSLHLRVKAIIKDCAERNKKQEPGYESVTQSMNKQLRQVVSQVYWKRAELYLDHFLKERAQGGSKSAQQILQKAQPVSSPNHQPAKSSSSGVMFRVEYAAPETLHDPSDVSRFLVQVSGGICDDCPICLKPLQTRRMVSKLKACGHSFCHSCIVTSLQHSWSCPMCRDVLDTPQGKMPSGSMLVRRIEKSCDGCSHCFQIAYNISDGKQKPYHMNPGVPFRSTQRTAYVPENEQGIALLKRLKKAFQCGLTFTIGTSLTTGRENVITWSSIHHKTTLGRGAHGFPDPNYFRNVNEELDNLGVPKALDL